MSDKISKADASYVDKSTRRDERCGNCNMFKPPIGCTLVSGHISAAGWCKFYEPADDDKSS